MNNLVVADATLGNDSALATALFDLLKDTRQLEYMAHQFHWNITGDKFKSMHDFYEEEYDQLFKDQDEIAEQIRQQGFFVPVIDNFVLGDEFKNSDFESQLMTYGTHIQNNIDLINRVNELARDSIAVQDLCARLQGLRSLSLNLKVKAMLGANKMSLEPSEATASAVTADSRLIIPKDIEKELKELGFMVVNNEDAQEDDEAIRQNEDGSFDVIEYEKGSIILRNAPGKRALMAGKYKKGFKFNDIKSLIDFIKKTDNITASAATAAGSVLGYIMRQNGFKPDGSDWCLPNKHVCISVGNCYNIALVMNDDDDNIYQGLTFKDVKKFIEDNINELKQFDNNPTTELQKKLSNKVSRLEYKAFSEAKVTAGFDKGRYKEIDEEPKFFKILREDCDIRPKIFYAINKGLRLAIRIVKGTFENASIRYFALKNEGGYIRVELNDKVYIIGYTIYDSGKIKVWTRELKTNVPVNAFDYSMLNMYAKPANIKMIQGMLPTWMSI